MAKLKTLKNGELFLMGDGSQHRLFSGAFSGLLATYVHNGTWNVMTTSTDVFRRTGNHPLTLDYDAAAGSAVFNPTHAVLDPIFYSDGTNVHCWYAYDPAGGSTYRVYYTYSTNGGTSWAAGVEVIALGVGGTWNDEDLWPVGVHYVDANTTYLFVAGNAGSSTWTIGRYTIDTSGGGGLPVEYADSAHYTQYGSNPVTSSMAAQYASVVYADGAYHMWHQNLAQGTLCYYNKSKDGLTWPQVLTSEVAMRRGINTTNDDNYFIIGNVRHHEGWFYLPYSGHDGSAFIPMLALSRDPRRLVKVGNIETMASFARAPFAADLTYTIPDQHVHISDRGRPGVLTDNTFQPMDLSFTFKLEGIEDDGIYQSAADGASGRIFQKLLLPNPSVREGAGFATSKPSCNIVYRLDSDSAGTKDDFYLFLDCHPLTTQISEQQDGTTVTVTMRCHGANMPLTGRF